MCHYVTSRFAQSATQYGALSHHLQFAFILWPLSWKMVWLCPAVHASICPTISPFPLSQPQSPIPCSWIFFISQIQNFKYIITPTVDTPGCSSLLPKALGDWGKWITSFFVSSDPDLSSLFISTLHFKDLKAGHLVEVTVARHLQCNTCAEMMAMAARGD